MNESVKQQKLRTLLDDLIEAAITASIFLINVFIYFILRAGDWAGSIHERKARDLFNF